MTQDRKKGFTIIELMLAMSFISVLLLAIAMTAIQAGKMYNKGLVLESVNQAGRDVGDTLRRDFLQTNAQLVSGDATGSVITVRDGGRDISARFCLGGHSYLWNLPDDGSIGATAARVVDASGRPINFVRVVDSGGMLCQPDAVGAYRATLPTGFAVTHLLKQRSDASEVVLAMHEMKVTPLTYDAGGAEALYRIEYIIGTSELSEINTARQCLPPADEQANSDFCAINNFEMIVRTNGQ